MLLHVIQSQVNPYEKGISPLKHPPEQHTQAQAPPAYIISHSRVFLMNEYNLRWDIGSKMRGSSYLYMLHDGPASLFSLCIIHILTSVDNPSMLNPFCFWDFLEKVNKFTKMFPVPNQFI